MLRPFPRRFVGGLITLGSLARIANAQPSTAKPHRIVFHVGGADPLLMSVALHNIANAADHYATINQSTEIELVANGPGYQMLRADISPVKDQIAELHKRLPAVVFSACQMSRKGVARAEGKAPEQIPQVPEATNVAFGVVRLTELQEAGWAYIRV